MEQRYMECLSALGSVIQPKLEGHRDLLEILGRFYPIQGSWEVCVGVIRVCPGTSGITSHARLWLFDYVNVQSESE